MDLPKKKYYSIGEVSTYCDVPQTSLRYWENNFDELKPVKRNKRRYYQSKDITLILQIKHLVTDKGFTLSGAKRIIRDQQGNDGLASLQSKGDKDLTHQLLMLRQKLIDMRVELDAFAK